MKIKLLSLSVLLGLSLFNGIFAQTTTLSTVPPLNGGNGAGGISFNVRAITAGVTITQLGCALTGTSNVEVWYRTTPITAAPNVTPANGWILAGTATAVNGISVGLTPTVQPIPIVLNIPIPQGATYGFFINYPTGTTIYTTQAAIPPTFTNANIEITAGGTAGWGGAAPNPPNNPRQFNGSVTYTTAAVAPNPFTLPPIANFAYDLGVDTVWVRSPYAFVNTSTGDSASYWEVIGSSGAKVC
ncbi:MAG: hypothetical protein ACK5XN_19915, partial [Bacteroidota bacterium]